MTPRPTEARRAFVAVRVHRGVICDVQAFQDEKSALHRAESWRRTANEEDDDIQVRETNVVPPPA